MEYVEKENATLLEMHIELWNYIEKTKRESNRNEYAHLFSLAFTQKKDNCRVLTNIPKLDMTPD